MARKWKAANQPYIETLESYHKKLGLAEKAIRDLEREQWARMIAYLFALRIAEILHGTFLSRPHFAKRTGMVSTDRG
ncbi:MAG: hypothetical protein M2R45_03320 [Verrucomicrobia subdivision 3 bacterium]|nr:hypothetical protein [Limisphaerales bacterium]MCS1415401.1 hypothetical protein [Limisphaerales bacterium]